MLDGAANIAPLFAEAQRLGMPALAITDHGNMFGAYEFWRKSREYGITPIIGMEAYCAPGSRFDKYPMFWGNTRQRRADEYGEGKDVSGAGAYTHLTLLAESAVGLRNLFALSSLASIEGHYRKPRCLLPGQEIITRAGMKRIEDIETGDQVLTHLGRFRPVVNVMRNLYAGDIYGIKLSGRYSRITWMTGEHPILIRHRRGDVKSWVEARAVIGGRPGTGTREAADCWNSWVCLPRPRPDTATISAINSADHIEWKPTPTNPEVFFKSFARRGMAPTNHYAKFPAKIELDFDFGYFLGLYLSEGHIDRAHTVSWAFHKNETGLVAACCKLIEKYTGKEAKINYRLDRPGYNGVSVSVHSSVLSQMLHSLCGSGRCHQLHMPDFTFEAPETFMEGIFQGVLAGDGSKTRPMVTGLTITSEQLHWQMRTLAARLRSDFAGSLRLPILSDKHMPGYLSYFSNATHRYTLSDNEYVYKPVREVISKPYCGAVYNIEVQEDNSYVTDFAVHNCDRGLLSRYSEGIIATTGCPSGETQTRLRLGQIPEALQAASDFRDIFGAGNYYLELMDHGLPIERQVRDGLLDIGRRLGIPPVATNDSHYVRKEDAAAHAALLCVQSGSTLTDPNRFQFEGDGYYLKPAEEMRALWDSQVPAACDNTLVIAERVESYDEVFAPAHRVPVFPVPEGHTRETWLASEVRSGLRRRFPGGAPAAYFERVDEELSLIVSTGFTDYFLIVADITTYARSQGIFMGPGRGSCTGSLVAFALGITELDPMKHGLLFERFLNPERVSPPDIDLDFDEARRDEVIDYTISRYGADCVAQIATFGTIKARAAIKDATRVLGYPYALGEKIAAALPAPVMAQDIPLEAITDAEHPRHGEAERLRELLRDNADAASVMDTARGLEGLIRQAGVHASGVVVSQESLIGVLPVWRRDKDNTLVTQFDMLACEDIGLLKMDFLGLRTLTVIRAALEAVKANHGREIDTATLELDDQATYALLSSGHTLGVFQLDSAAMRSLLRALAPTHFGDIAAVLALYRPGPLAANAHLDYAKRSSSRQEITPIHPELRDALEPILGETYHLLVYQEQVMAIAQRLAGYSLGGADLLRRAMGKKKKEIIEKEFQRFRDGMMGKGFSGEATQTLWDVMLPFAGYAFNKSHTAGYGLVSYWTAYLKANYPTEFMAAQLTSIGDNKDKSAIYLAECRRMGIPVSVPDINASGATFTPTAAGIRFGLTAVRDVGSRVVDAIIAGRPYASFADFLRKVDVAGCNRRAVAALIKAGAFDSLGHPRQGLSLVADRAIDGAVPTKKNEAIGQFGLFDDEPGTFDVAVPEKEWEPRERLALERGALGLYVSGHPLDSASHILGRKGLAPITAILDGTVTADSRVKVAGLLTGVEHKVSKAGNQYARARLEGLDASVELVVFSKAYTAFTPQITEDAIVVMEGRVSDDGDEGAVKLIVDRIETPDAAPQAEPLTLRMSVADCTPERVERLSDILSRHPGAHPVRVALINGDSDRRVLLQLDGRQVTPSAALTRELAAIL